MGGTDRGQRYRDQAGPVYRHLSVFIHNFVAHGTGRWGLTSLRMLCAWSKGFASKSLVPPPTEHPTSLDPTSRLRDTTLPNVRHPLTRTSPSSGTRIHCIPIRPHLPVPSATIQAVLCLQVFWKLHQYSTEKYNKNGTKLKICAKNVTLFKGIHFVRKNKLSANFGIIAENCIFAMSDKTAYVL